MGGIFYRPPLMPAVRCWPLRSITVGHRRRAAISVQRAPVKPLSHSTAIPRRYLSRMGPVGWSIDMERMGYGSIGMKSGLLCDFELYPHQWHWTWIFMARLSNSHISGMGGSIDLERKGCECPSMHSWTYNMGLPVGYCTYQMHWPCNGLMQNL